MRAGEKDKRTGNSVGTRETETDTDTNCKGEGG